MPPTLQDFRTAFPELTPTKSTGTVTLTGTAGTTIPAGSEVQSTNGDVFVTDAEVTIPSAGTVNVAVTADEFGAVRAAAATITTIITIVDARPGWTGVTNAAAVMVGREGVPDDAAQMALNSAVQFHNQTSRGTLLCAAHLATADGLVEILRSTEGPVSTIFAQFDGGTFWATTSYGREFRELEKRLPPVMFAV